MFIGGTVFIRQYLKYYFKFHVCLSIPVVRNLWSVWPKKIFSLFNVIICRLPGGARKYPRSGYFLVLNITKVNNVSPDNFAPPSIYNYLCIKGMYQIFTVFIYHDLLMVIIILTAYRGFLRIHF